LSVSLNCGGIFDLDAKRTEIAALEARSTGADFWNDTQRAQQVLKKINTLKKNVDDWDALHKDAEEAALLYEISSEENDRSVEGELKDTVQKTEAGIARLEMIKMLSGEDDHRDAILSIHPGAGGTESHDWASILYRMYTRWIEIKEFAATTLDFQEGEEAGIKSATIEVKGLYAYGNLKAEIGVHRLVRISPFDSNARRHTSFASIFAYPVIEDVEFDLPESEIRIDIFRAGGKGGQNVNKVETAVRMTHLPTNIVAQCQTERSQLQNRINCLKVLKARVYQKYREDREKELNAKLAEKKKIEWGSQIRSYVLHPYQMVKDHRSGYETSNTQDVLNGMIDPFIREYLLKSI
jgi:peptide chain release factor 2